MTHTRRQFLTHLGKMAVVGAAFTMAPHLMAENALAALPKSKTLVFRHTHTNKDLRITYAVGDKYLPDALRTLNKFLRDPYNGAMCRMDPRLFDLLYHLKLSLGSKQPFQIVSAYRSPATNARMRRTGHDGVAKNSLHMSGKAIDLRLADVSLRDLRDAAMDSRMGGVGYYPEDRFVHVDTGQIRHW